ncbi:MAG: HlyD family efflux transporter periplasmic adaptor subunit [Planctomycetaceae bacterium]
MISGELSQAKVDAAKADVDLAQWRLDQATVRAPFSGEVLRVLAAEGQYLRSGDAVAVIGDVSQLQVEVPADKSGARAGEPFALKIDGADVQGKVEEVLPLDPRFDPLRELFDSIASVVVSVDNAGGNFRPGQTVYVPLIPRQPVAEIPASAVGNLPNGQRKIQVLRDLVVRDLPVTLMGSVGAERIFVSGPFADRDEVIYESSHLLADGFPLKPGSDGKIPDAKKGNSKTGKSAPSF